MRYVTKQELRAEIQKIIGARFTNFMAETEVRMNKTGNPYIGATKIAHVLGNLGCNYENVVNNKQERNGQERDFIAQPPKGKVHTDNKHFLTDTKTGTKTYLVVYPVTKSQERQESQPTKYYFNGQEIEKSLLEPFFVKQSESKTGIIYRTYNFDNILSMTLGEKDNKEEYRVVEHLTTQEREVVETRETINA